MAASYGKNTAGCLSGRVLADDFYVLAADLKFLRLHLKKPKTIFLPNYLLFFSPVVAPVKRQDQREGMNILQKKWKSTVACSEISS
jgi:hypothetical protein